MGRKHQPAFRLVLTESQNSTKSGRFKEVLGSYDPRKLNEVLKTDRIKHWLSTGATATATVHNLLVKKGVVRGKKIDVSAGEAPAPTPVDNNPQPTTDNSQPETPAPEAPAQESAPAETPAPAEAPVAEETPAPAPTETA